MEREVTNTVCEGQDVLVVLRVMYGCKALAINQKEWKMHLLGMKCLRTKCGVRRVDQVRNERIREEVW